MGGDPSLLAIVTDGHKKATVTLEPESRELKVAEPQSVGAKRDEEHKRLMPNRPSDDNGRISTASADDEELGMRDEKRDRLLSSGIIGEPPRPQSVTSLKNSNTGKLQRFTKSLESVKDSVVKVKFGKN